VRAIWAPNGKQMGRTFSGPRRWRVGKRRIGEFGRVFHVKHSGAGPDEADLRARVAQIGDQTGVELTSEQIDRAVRVSMWLADLARASGISGYRSPVESLERGIGPAFAYLGFVAAPRTGKVGDLGAGNGALGAGLAILAPGLEVALLDRAKRAFTACELLVGRSRLPNLKAVLMDAGAAGDAAGTYDAIIFRALARGRSALELAAPLVREGGFIGAYHQDGDQDFSDDGGEGPQNGLKRLGSRETLVGGLRLTGFRALASGFPQ